MLIVKPWVICGKIQGEPMQPLRPELAAASGFGAVASQLVPVLVASSCGGSCRQKRQPGFGVPASKRWARTKEINNETETNLIG